MLKYVRDHHSDRELPTPSCFSSKLASPASDPEIFSVSGGKAG